MKPVGSWPIGRLALAFLGVILIAIGALRLASGELLYQRWWGGYGFSPFVIFGGIVALITAIRSKPSNDQ